MAEAFLKKYAGEVLEIYSAGYNRPRNQPLHPESHGRKGFDLSGHNSKGVHDFLGKKEFRYLIIVCEAADKACPKNFPGVIYRIFWPFDDPAAVTASDEEKLAKFRQVRDQIDQRIRTWLHELPRFDSYWQDHNLEIAIPPAQERGVHEKGLVPVH